MFIIYNDWNIIKKETIMRKLLIILIISTLIMGCFEGPTGPQGEQGEQGPQGESLEIITLWGILVAGDMITDNDWEYWDIELPDLNEEFLISVHCNAGQEYSLVNPNIWGVAFYENKYYARIFQEDGFVEPGFQYRIAIAY